MVLPNIFFQNVLAYTLGMRHYRRLLVRLSEIEEKEIKALLRKGVSPARVLLRSLALLQLSEGLPAPRVAQNLKLTAKSVREIGWRYLQGGLDRALYEKPRPGAAALLGPNDQKRILAMVCEKPPEGHARWTVRLIAQEAVKRRLVPSVGRETIRLLLLNHDLRPWRQKSSSREET